MLHHDEQLTNEVREVRVVVVFVHVQHFVVLIADTIVNIVSLIFLVLVLRCRKFPRVAGNIFAIATENTVLPTHFCGNLRLLKMVLKLISRKI